jgi:hypothetical protein
MPARERKKMAEGSVSLSKRRLAGVAEHVSGRELDLGLWGDAPQEASAGASGRHQDGHLSALRTSSAAHVFS